MSPVLDFDYLLFYYLLFCSFFLVKGDISTVEHFSQFDIIQSISILWHIPEISTFLTLSL